MVETLLFYSRAHFSRFLTRRILGIRFSFLLLERLESMSGRPIDSETLRCCTFFVLQRGEFYSWYKICSLLLQHLRFTSSRRIWRLRRGLIGDSPETTFGIAKTMLQFLRHKCLRYCEKINGIVGNKFSNVDVLPVFVTNIGNYRNKNGWVHIPQKIYKFNKQE